VRRPPACLSAQTDSSANARSPDRIITAARFCGARACPAVYAPHASSRKRSHFYLNTSRIPMPTYHVEMMEGRTVEQKKKLVQEITRVSVEVLGGSPESVDIIITDIKRENWATGAKLWSEPRD
jgi:4-oxalocrotonate tautomerase